MFKHICESHDFFKYCVGIGSLSVSGFKFSEKSGHTL